MLAIDFADLINADDVGVTQIRRRLGFGIEPLDVQAVGKKLLGIYSEALRKKNNVR